MQNGKKRWEDAGLFNAKDDDAREKFYLLVEFPYPSGAGLHVGHPRSYTALDTIARKKRMEGKNVLFPMGWDAFGLPAENYAIKTGNHPATFTQTNIDTFRRQLKSMGFSFDWSREFSTTDPAYYKWTQWMFCNSSKRGWRTKLKSRSIGVRRTSAASQTKKSSAARANVVEHLWRSASSRSG